MAGECFPAVDGRFGLERHSDVQLYCPEGGRDGGPDIGKLSQLHVHNLLECDAAMCAATLILEDKSPGVADGEETLSDDPESVLHTHVRKESVVDECHVGVEQVEHAVNDRKQLLDVLMVEERQAVQVSAIDLTFLLEPGLGQPHLVVKTESLTQLCSRNVKLSEARGIAIDRVVRGELKVGVLASTQITVLPGG